MPDGFITFTSGRTITVAVLQPDGSARGSNPHAATEYGSTGIYKFTEAAMVAGDFCRASDSVYGYIGGEEYKPEVKDIDSILADTNEIQGKLPTNKIMGSSDVDNHDTDIDAIKAKTDSLNFTGTDVKATLDSEKVVVSAIDNIGLTAQQKADVNAECDTALTDYGANKIAPATPTNVSDAAEAIIEAITGSSETETLLNTLNDVLNLLEADVVIDDTDATQWKKKLKQKGTETILLIKKLQDINGNPIISKAIPISKEVHSED